MKIRYKILYYRALYVLWQLLNLLRNGDWCKGVCSAEKEYSPRVLRGMWGLKRSLPKRVLKLENAKTYDDRFEGSARPIQAFIDSMKYVP